MQDIRLYTVADLREWLENKRAAEGLSERVISPTRAWAIIHNPYVKSKDAIAAAIFDNGELAAFTASFPDMLDDKRIWWASTLYCYPKFTGKGYGMVVIGCLIEAHEPEMTYDRWGAQETIEIFNHFGYQTTYTYRYHLSDKKINTSSIKGKFAYSVQALKKCLHPWKKQSKVNYTLREVLSIDDEAYAFMRFHRGTDLWFREQDMLNWIVQYPFVKAGKEDDECVFCAMAKVYEYKVAKVYVEDKLNGVYVLRMHDESLSVVYLYYNDEMCDVVFDSIIDCVLDVKPKQVILENRELLIYVKQRLYFPKMEEEKVSLSLPVYQPSIESYTLQLGDGDSFA